MKEEIGLPVENFHPEINNETVAFVFDEYDEKKILEQPEFNLGKYRLANGLQGMSIL